MDRYQERYYYQMGRFHLIVTEYDWTKIEEIIKTNVSMCERETWEESVAILSRYFLWEYEDHEYIDGGDDDDYEDEDDDYDCFSAYSSMPPSNIAFPNET